MSNRKVLSARRRLNKLLPQLPDRLRLEALRLLGNGRNRDRNVIAVVRWCDHHLAIWRVEQAKSIADMLAQGKQSLDYWHALIDYQASDNA